MVILLYKTRECENRSCRVGENCWFYHSLADRRRPVIARGFHGFRYSSRICNSVLECRNEECSWAHNSYETQFHPEKFKTELCGALPCLRMYCSFAHSESEIRDISRVPGDAPTQLSTAQASTVQSVKLEIGDLMAFYQEKGKLQQELVKVTAALSAAKSALLCAHCRRRQSDGVKTCCGLRLCFACHQTETAVCLHCREPNIEFIPFPH